MMTNRRIATVFREGDEVMLAEGSYQGTLGIFLRLREDVNWADITERNGSIRSHPVAWLAHVKGCDPFRELTPAKPAILAQSGPSLKWRKEPPR